MKDLLKAEAKIEKAIKDLTPFVDAESNDELQKKFDEFKRTVRALIRRLKQEEVGR